MSIYKEKKEKAVTFLTQIREQISQAQEQLDGLKRAEQQLIGRVQTYEELEAEDADTAEESVADKKKSE